MMMMMAADRRGGVFTEAQLKELQLQTLIFRYLVSGFPIPGHLVDLLRRPSFPFSMGAGRRLGEEDPEPWRCKRTDGKKWRCSREAAMESKYCERHMHRGKKSSRKLVELPPASSPSSSSSSSSPSLSPFINTQLVLGPSSYDHQGQRFLQGKEKQHHCFVLGADLMSNEVDKRKKPLLCLFKECPEDQAYPKTQLSISIP